MNEKTIEQLQKEHWKKMLTEHGNQPRAVGSESKPHKFLRYERISYLFRDNSDFSLLDLGAGVGDYFGYIKANFAKHNIDYTGLEITKEFCDIARSNHPGIRIKCQNILDEEASETYDYVILSGVFHQCGGARTENWENQIERLIMRAYEICNKGIAFNVLSNYVDYYKEGNYYGNLSKITDFIVLRLSRFLCVDLAYPLFEATFCVYKPSYIRSLYPEPEFQKYLKK